MKNEFPIDEEWLPFEIHPDTPPKGVLWADYFPGMNPTKFFGQLDERGKELGVRFGAQPLMSNSRMALMGGEFAKEHGRHDQYHEAIFRTFFTECRDIGRRDVVLGAARSAGLDADQLREALEGSVYIPRLAATTQEARVKGITGAPTFVVNGQARVVGAVPLEELRAVLRKAQDRSAGP